MRKYGKTAAGKQRWSCPVCRVSATRRRPDVRRGQWRRAFWRWLDDSRKMRSIAADLRVSRSTLYRRFCVFLDNIPAAPPPSPADCLLLDGFWLRGGQPEVVLIASQKGEVLSFAFAAAESRKAWGDFIAMLPPPRLVVTDGHPALLHAVAAQWAHIPRQRCLRHISEEVRKKLWGRRDNAGRELEELREDLFAVRNKQQRQRWLARFARWQKRHAEVLEERVARTDRIGRVYHRYAHPRLRAARAHLRNALPVMFCYLSRPGAAHTTNHLEGGINSGLRELLHTHRGLSRRRQKALIAHFLLSKCEQKNNTK